jgi:hypothetical protein
LDFSIDPWICVWTASSFLERQEEAVGAFAMGALAIGRLAIRRLPLGNAKIGSLEIDNLVVKRIQAAEIAVSGSLTLPADDVERQLSKRSDAHSG